MTGPIDKDQTYRYRFPVKDSAGVLTNAGSVTVTLTLPDGTTTSPTVVNSSTGIYDIAYTTSQAGLHRVHAVATGGVLGTETDVWEDAFVAEESGRLFIGVDEALAYLRAQSVITDDIDREQMREMCLFACAAVEGDLGLAIAPRVVTETFDGGCYELNLTTKPPRASDGGSISISSVTVNGVAVTDYVLRKRGWRLMRGSTTSRSIWDSGYENISVTYVPGCAVPPRPARVVALNTLQLTWQATQQAEHPFLDQFVSRTTIGSRTTIATSALASISQVQDAAYHALRASNLA